MIMAKADKKPETIGEVIVDLIKTLVYAGLIAGAFRTLFFQPFWIPSASMKDTLLIGDFLFVNKMAYGYSAVSCPFSLCPISGRILGSEPQRGDVVVFRHPVSNEDYIKRLIGLPGDKVQVKAGVVWLNGVALPQEPAGVFEEIMEPQGSMGNYPNCSNGRPQEGQPCVKNRLIETLPEGKQHAILNTAENERLDDTGIFEVPPGHYFFMGDNRDDSTDSRVSQDRSGVGFVPAENLIGRADRIVFSSAGKSLLFFWTWRSDRFFKSIE
jgi:signal peptidase I